MQAAFEGPSGKSQYSLRRAWICHKQLKGPLPGLDNPPPSSVAVTSSVEIPAMEAILMTLDGLSADVPFRSKGCTLGKQFSIK